MDVSAVGARIGRRFYVVNLLPSSVLVAVVAVLLGSGAPGSAPSLTRLRHTLGDLSVEEAALGALAVVALALLISPFQVHLTKVTEGYFWPERGPLSGLRGWCMERHQGIRRRINDEMVQLASPDSTAAESVPGNDMRLTTLRAKFDQYPSRDRVMPTTFGNALRQAEDWAGEKRYGLDVIGAIPRMYPMMPESMVAVMNGARNEMDTLVMFTWVWCVSTVISVPLLIAHGAWLAVSLGALTLAWASYRGAILAARRYGETLVWAMDLYRFDLIEQLRFQPAPTRGQEPEHNRIIMLAIAGSGDREAANLEYVHCGRRNLRPSHGHPLDAGD